MKTRYLPIIAAILVVGIASCAKNEDTNIGYTSGIIEFAASNESPETKAILNNEGTKILWEPGDSVNVFYGDAAAGFRAATTEESATTKFTGIMNVEENGTEKFVAVYPYRKTTKYDGSSIVVDIPDIQIARTGSFDREAFVTIATSTDHNLQFKNLCGGVAFTVIQANVNRVVFKGGDGEFLAGKAIVTMDENGIPKVTNIVDGKTSLELRSPNGQYFEKGKWYYISAIPQDLKKGFKMEFYGSGKAELKNEESISIKRSIWGRLKSADEDSKVSFEDANFKAYCVENFDMDGDGEISYAEALNIEEIYVCTDSIYSLSGIECFTNLNYLYACGSSAIYKSVDGSGSATYGNWSSLDDPAEGTSAASGKLSRVDLSGLTNLRGIQIFANNCITYFAPGNCPLLTLIDCWYCNITELDLSNNPALSYLNCRGNQLTELDISNNTSLSLLYCDNNHLTELDVSNNKYLSRMECNSNQLTQLDLRENQALRILSCLNNQLTELNLSNNSLLIDLRCDYNQLIELNVSNNEVLSSLNCNSNQLKTLDVSNNTVLSDLWCFNNHLTGLDVSNNKSLSRLECGENQLTELDISKNKSLSRLDCHYNQLTELDVSNNSGLEVLYCYSNPSLTTVWLKTGQAIQSFVYDSEVTEIKYKGDPSEDIQYVPFADPNFKAYCIKNYDTDSDGEISIAEALSVTYISVNTDNIESLQGIEFFSNIRELCARGNAGKHSSVDGRYGVGMAHGPNGVTLDDLPEPANGSSIASGRLSEIDISNLHALQRLDISMNSYITCFSPGSCPSLRVLNCSYCNITELDITNNIALSSLDCSCNQLTGLDVSNNKALTSLGCGYNKLTGLDVSNNTALTDLGCYGNQLTTLDVSNNIVLTWLDCNNNPYLNELWLKNGQSIANLNYDSNVTTIKYK